MSRSSLQSPVSSLQSGFSAGLSITIIGAGKMGQALIGGLLAQRGAHWSIRAVETDASTRKAVARRFRIAVSDEAVRAVRQADVVLLAVKPQQFEELLSRISPAITRQQLVISIAAGITTRWLEKRLSGVAIVRVMPNLPATVGCGYSAVAAGRHATVRHRRIALVLFGAVGYAVELPERYFDAITAVSGSGPAYVFYLAQIWQEAAQRLGLPADVAACAIDATLKGSVRLLRCSGEPAHILVGKVASKGGTTEAALHVFHKRRLAAHFAEALRAAARRSKELSR